MPCVHLGEISAVILMSGEGSRPGSQAGGGGKRNLKEACLGPAITSRQADSRLGSGRIL